MVNGKGWLKQWFREIKKWEPNMGDSERVTWLCIYGVPCHSWNPKFIEFITRPLGMHMRSDDGTNVAWFWSEPYIPWF